MKTNIKGLIVLISFISSAFCYAQEGSLDLSFDGDGIVTALPGTSSDIAYDLFIQNDGKILVCGSSYQASTSQQFVTIAKFNTNGTLDNSFSTDGIEYIDIPLMTNERAIAVLQQPDGKILLSGDCVSSTTGYDYMLIRLNQDGTLDNTFDGDGIITLDIGSGSDQGRFIGLQSDGKIVMNGSTGNSFGIVRFNTNGSLDNSFGVNGMVITNLNINNSLTGPLLIQPDDKIVCGGHNYPYPGNNSDSRFAIVRLNSDGSFDNSFDSDGIVFTDFSSGVDPISSLSIQPDGKIFAVGRYNDGVNNKIAAARYNTNGSLDTGFDSDGKLTLSIGIGNDVGVSSSIQSDGKILVGGRTQTGTGNDIVLVRFNNDGSLDNTFDNDGVVITNVGNSSDGNQIKLQSDGKILFCGYTNSPFDFLLLRYNGCSAPSQPSTISGASTVCNGSSQTFSVTNVAGVAYNWTFPAGWSQTAGGTSNSITVTVGIGSGIVTVTPSNSCGNGTPRILATTVSDVPAQPSAVSGSNSFCADNLSQLYSVTNDPNVDNYTWTLPSGWSGTSTTNSILTTATTNGGTISVTSNNGCGASVAQTLVIIVNDLPVVSYIQNPEITCVNFDPFELSTATPSGGNYSGFGVNGTTFDPSGAGIGNHLISYFYTDGNGCSAMSSDMITVDDCLEVDDKFRYPITVAPNPFNDEIYFYFDDKDEHSVQLMNSIGQIVYEGKVSFFNSTINTSQFNCGMYILKIDGYYIDQLVKR